MSEFEKLFNHLKECVDNDDNTGITEDGIEFNLFEWSFGLAVKAKKEYDRLEAENAKLLEFAKKASELDIETFHFETQDGDEDFIEYICTDILDDANELIEKLEMKQ